MQYTSTTIYRTPHPLFPSDKNMIQTFINLFWVRERPGADRIRATNMGGAECHFLV